MNKIIDFDKLTVVEYVKKIKNGEFTASSAVEFFISKIKKDNHNAVLEVFEDAVKCAKQVDNKIKAKTAVGKLAGVPIIIKDNILYKGHIASAGSKILECFVSPYSATIVDKLLIEDAIILGRANMDEFGMGSTGENSAYGATHNAHKLGHVAGGSSSGSAVAVASGLCLASIGTDTGASVRTPAAYNGLYAIKPTYGSVSRHGIIAYASSLEQAGVIAKTAQDLELIQKIISGKDGFDGTAIDINTTPFSLDITKLKIGRIAEVWKDPTAVEDYDKYIKVFEWLQASGAEIKEVSIENLKESLSAYYIIATAEATSNLARYDGVKYTKRSDNAKNLNEVYKRTRTEFFGQEVKRRIMLGNFVLSSGYFDAYYKKAKMLQSVIREQFNRVFESVDIVIMPITLSDAPTMGSLKKTPTQMYYEDLFTVPANITGMPALAIPFDKGKQSLPIGFQVLANMEEDEKLYQFASFFDKERGKL